MFVCVEHFIVYCNKSLIKRRRKTAESCWSFVSWKTSEKQVKNERNSINTISIAIYLFMAAFLPYPADIKRCPSFSLNPPSAQYFLSVFERERGGNDWAEKADYNEWKTSSGDQWQEINKGTAITRCHSMANLSPTIIVIEIITIII